MTGFGAAEGPIGSGSLRVELKSVNHRYLVVSIKAPSEFAGFEGEIRDLLRRRFERGHFTVSCRWSGTQATAPGVDVDRAKAVAARLRELDAAVGGTGGVTLDLIVRQTEMAVGRDEVAGPEWSAVAAVIARAADDCQATRALEGQALGREIRDRLEGIRRYVEQVRARAPERLIAERSRLRASVAALLEGRSPDEGRLAQEIALLADRLDITEELVRLGAHLDAAIATLERTGPVGKHLGFLAQEIGREVNTVGSKANDVAIQHLVVEMKGELERFREQLENLE
jgi:uncharacterized protein (TIGR00255 family)